MIKKNSLPYFILLALEKSIRAHELFIDFAYHHHEMIYSSYPREIKYGALYQAVRDLRKKGFIETSKNEGKMILKLTDRGREEAIIKKLLNRKNWDGKWRIVIFDIPEKHRKLRQILRGKLKEWEFEKWQKSVWASKKDLTIPLRKFIEEVDLKDWVRVLVANDV